jgi:hypothetical protein
MGSVNRTTGEYTDFGLVEERKADIDGQTVSFVTFKQTVDGAPLLKGLPGDQCHCPHWGYVTRGSLTFAFADRVEVYEAGDAYYVPPGHTPAASEDSETVMFSPTDLLRETEEQMARNMQHA